MIKIKPSFYARALWEISREKTEGERKTIVNNFLCLLQKNKQLKLWPQIMQAYEKLMLEKEKVILATVTTEKEITATELAKITSFLQKEEEVEKVELTVIKEKLGVGLMVETAEKRWNLTLNKQITDFKKQLVS